MLERTWGKSADPMDTIRPNETCKTCGEMDSKNPHMVGRQNARREYQCSSSRTAQMALFLHFRVCRCCPPPKLVSRSPNYSSRFLFRSTRSSGVVVTITMVILQMDGINNYYLSISKL
mmetsp:Transcript_19320/g.35059  ORF Transcript_19320/g.35059 Transcript_19320/m.35059 type:complete len:118 (-) Transcript_19320:36-389(-)